MWRALILPCAAIGLLGLTVGCKVESTPSGVSITKHEDAVKDAEVKFKELEASMADLKTKAEKATGEEKKALEAKWAATAPKREAAAKKLEQLKTAAKDKWQEFHKDAVKEFDEVKKSIQ